MTNYKQTCCSFLAGTILLVAAMLTSGAALAQAVSTTLPEPQVKAAYLLNFLRYVEWPDDTTRAPIRIAVIGDDDVAAELRRIGSVPALGGRSLEVEIARDTAQIGSVHILYLGQRENARLARHISRVTDRPILTVTHADDALDHGSIINFVKIEDRIRFEVALDSAEKSKLRVSSRLLAVALRIRKGDMPPKSDAAVIIARH